MNTGLTFAGPLPPLEELARRAGIALPQKATGQPVVDLGEVRPPPIGDQPKNSRMGEQVVKSIEDVRQVAIRNTNRFAEPYSRELRAETVVLRYADYLESTKNTKKVQAGFEFAAKTNNIENNIKSIGIDQIELFLFVYRFFNKEMHTPDIQGYLNYVCTVNAGYGKCIERIPIPALYDAVRAQHTYITGSSGSGKTELLKALVLHDVQHGNAAVIIDPTGNFARAVAMWPEFAGKGAERLVYINPRLAHGMVPTMNPLDARHLTKEERSILAGQLTDVMEQVVGKGDWTTQTENVSRNCLQVAVNTDGATLRDLRVALAERGKKGSKPNTMTEALIRLGKQHHIDEVRNFFTYDFEDPQYISSKNSLNSKLSNILSNELFASITSQKSKIRLEKLIDDRKIIVFDLGAWGDNKAAGAFGRFVIAQLAAIGLRRSTKYGEAVTPVHVFVDEADVFVSPAVLDILSKLRQHGIYMTLAQQTVGYGFEGANKQQLLNNTAIKFAAGDGQRDMLSMMHAPADATRGLKQGQFVGRWGRDGEAFILTVRSDRLKDSLAMTPAQWEEVVSGQLARYYTRKEETDASPDDEAPASSGLSPPPRKRRRLN